MQLAALGVFRAAQVDDRGNAGAADGHIGEALAPGAPERVAHDDGDLDTGLALDAVTDLAGGTVGVDRQECGITGIDVGQVDAGVGADEAVRRFTDDELAARRRAAAKDADRLLQDVALVVVDDVGVDGDEPILSLRHDLLGDDDDVAVAQPGFRHGRGEDEVAEDVTGSHFRDAFDRDQLHAVHCGSLELSSVNRLSVLIACVSFTGGSAWQHRGECCLRQ